MPELSSHVRIMNSPSSCRSRRLSLRAVTSPMVVSFGSTPSFASSMGKTMVHTVMVLLMHANCEESTWSEESVAARSAAGTASVKASASWQCPSPPSFG
jgi:hypothetical protein